MEPGRSMRLHAWNANHWRLWAIPRVSYRQRVAHKHRQLHFEAHLAFPCGRLWRGLKEGFGECYRGLRWRIPTFGSYHLLGCAPWDCEEGSQCVRLCLNLAPRLAPR